MAPKTITECRADFPALLASPRLVYLDSAATTLKPRQVVQEMRWFLEEGTSAVHRGVHARSVEATERFESVREQLAQWFDADANEVVFTHGATEAINLVRQGLSNLRHVAITQMEHHSNFIPWQSVERCDVIGVNDSGEIDRPALESSLREGAELVALTQQSNVLGCVTDIISVTELAHRHGAAVLVDAAQSSSHDQPQLHGSGTDFIVCSAHKMLGPSGVGALVMNRKWHSELQPMIYGGHMVDQVHQTGWTLQPAPHRFEAGTAPIENVLGWGAALGYLQGFEHGVIETHLKDLTSYLMGKLMAIPGVDVTGPQDAERGPLVSFRLQGMEVSAIAKILSQRDQICIRSGYHCAQPLHEHLGIGPTARISLQIYNTRDDIDRCCAVLESVAKIACM